MKKTTIIGSSRNKTNNERRKKDNKILRTDTEI